MNGLKMNSPKSAEALSNRLQEVRIVLEFVETLAEYFSDADAVRGTRAIPDDVDKIHAAAFGLMECASGTLRTRLEICRSAIHEANGLSMVDISIGEENAI